MTMRFRLPRPCIRLLKYLALLTVIALVFTHGLAILSRRKIMLYPKEFDNRKIVFDKEGHAVLEKALDKFKNLVESGSKVHLKDLRDDYDTEVEPLEEVFAQIDNTLIRLRNNADEDGQYNNNEEDAHEKTGNMNGKRRVGEKDYLRQNIDANANFMRVRGKVHTGEGKAESDKSVNIIISSYGINKSTVLDDLFRDKAGVIMFDQPSLTLWPLWYLRGDNKVCSMKSTACRMAGEDTSTIVMKCLIGLLQCSAEALEACLSSTQSVSHRDIAQYDECRRKAGADLDPTTCRGLLQNMCSSASIRVLNVRNLALDLLGQISEYTQNTKIIHVFRDPRTVMFSEKMREPTYLSKSGDAFFKRVKTLCKRTKLDIDIANNIPTHESAHTFKIIMHEELFNGTKSHLTFSKLFNMVVKRNFTVYDVIRNSVPKIISRHKARDKVWRFETDTSVMATANLVCNDVLGQLRISLIE